MFFVIERKSDGFRFPEVKSGYTWAEPTDKGAPRLFTTARGAANALTLWLKGGYRAVHHPCGEFGDDTWTEIAPVEQKNRGTADDYEIVPVAVCRMVSK